MPETRVVVDVSRHSSLPDVCIQCGAATHRRVRVKVVGPRPPVEVEREPASVWRSVLGFLPGFGCLFSMVFFFAAAFERRGPPAPMIKVRVPQCPECGRGGKPVPVHAEFDHGFLRSEAAPRFLEWKEQLARCPTAVDAPPRGTERRQ